MTCSHSVVGNFVVFKSKDDASKQRQTLQDHVAVSMKALYTQEHDDLNEPYSSKSRMHNF